MSVGVDKHDMTFMTLVTLMTSHAHFDDSPVSSTSMKCSPSGRASSSGNSNIPIKASNNFTLNTQISFHYYVLLLYTLPVLFWGHAITFCMLWEENELHSAKIHPSHKKLIPFKSKSLSKLQTHLNHINRAKHFTVDSATAKLWDILRVLVGASWPQNKLKQDSWNPWLHTAKI